MTIHWSIESSRKVNFAEACEYFESAGSGLFSKDLDVTASVLRGLYEDRDFFVDFLVAQLKAGISVENSYSSQVFVLRKSKYYTLRAVVWDAPRGLPGEEMFLYEMPHDHDFSFFTLGYHGPGYETEVYSYDNESVVGVKGEEVETSGHERWRLSERKVVLFEGGKDIHSQSPPESLSVSFNVLQDVGAFEIKRRQYQFDGSFSRIEKVLNVNPLPLFVRAACAVGGDAVEYVEEIARSAPSGYSRAAALKALVQLDEKYVGLAMRDNSSYVRNAVADIL
ncbi:hypothetical protein [Stenotrophomonas rhizophila]|uniref:hypothetical protein n=1 Tax=Stenotrophomonas rhizophila TaxID=216778 RepID=UPI001E47D1A0|nr:hypothetical protein [Stenotrophomonas rhizophila]MCC7635857.1 hypothetical protein [Stenotrophomonas rhizophila]MCC7662681.1 hypothetical protein [Stenotrophomonas rhizophila]